MKAIEKLSLSCIISRRMMWRVVALSAVLSLSGPFTIISSHAHEAGQKSGLRVVIIGATAAAANELIPQALWRGHEVIAFARRPHRVRHAEHPRLSILKGDVYDTASIEAAFTGDGEEIVISVIGPRIDPGEEVPDMDLFSQGTTNIIEAMKENGNKRLIVTSATAVQETAKLGYRPDTPTPEGLTQGTGLHYYNMRGIYNDMIKMENIALNSGLEATVIRPGQIFAEPARGDLLITVDRETPNRRILTYADFANFILEQAELDQNIGSIVGLYSERGLESVDMDSIQAEMAKMRNIKLQVAEDLAADQE